MTFSTKNDTKNPSGHAACDILVEMNLNEDLLYGEIGKGLLKRRLQLGMTQAQVGERAGILRTSVANFETARQRVPLHALYRLCAALELEVSSVLPATGDVISMPVETVDIEGNLVRVPPRAAETLRQLRNRLVGTNRGEGYEPEEG